MGDYNTWWGFTASNSADNSRPENTLTQQWSNMALGGIVLDSEGKVSTDKFGAPVTSATVPYMVAFYNAYFSSRPCDMVFTDGKAYQAVGVYVNLNSYPYYSIEYGDSFARAFTNGDNFKLIIHGVAPDESERTVEVTLAEYTNGNLTINRGWRYVDLTPLGEVNELYFTMESTDSGDYGMNTPGYFCLDKLMVKPATSSSVNAVATDSNAISYDRASATVTLRGRNYAAVYDTAGHQVMSADSNSFSIAGLPAGVYIIRTQGGSLKIAR